MDVLYDCGSFGFLTEDEMIRKAGDAESIFNVFGKNIKDMEGYIKSPENLLLSTHDFEGHSYVPVSIYTKTRIMDGVTEFNSQVNTLRNKIKEFLNSEIRNFETLTGHTISSINVVVSNFSPQEMDGITNPGDMNVSNINLTCSLLENQTEE